MKPHSITILTAAALLLGGATLAPAQDRGEKGGPAAQSEPKGGPGGAAAGRGDGGQERGARSSGRDEGAPKGGAERGGRSAEDRGDRGGDAGRSARDKGGEGAREGRDRSGGEEKAARDKGDRGSREAREKPERDKGEAKEAREKSGRDAREARDKGERDAKETRGKGGRDAREAREKSERDAREARETETRDKDRARREARERDDRDGGAATGAPTRDRPGSGESGRREAGDRDRIRDVQLTEERRTRVRETFRRQSVRELRDVDFSISIGTRVPRRIELYPIPAAVIDIVPQYRGYRYFVVQDDIVIVEPDTYEIVYVIDERDYRSAGNYGGGGGGGCDRLELSDTERRLILRTIERDRDAGDVVIRVGERVPERFQLHTFPDQILQEVSKVGTCRYTIIGDELAIIDPNDREVVVLLDY